MSLPSRIRTLVASAFLLLTSASVAIAQGGGSYPNHPIRMVVAFPPGGGADLTARTLAQKMGDAMGQPVVVDNRAGANGTIGTDAVAKAPPDGYTILLVDRGSLGINPSLYAKLPYDPLKDFIYIGIAAEGPYVLVVNAAQPVTTLAELVALAKASPGTINYSSFGSMGHLNGEALNQRLGTDFVHVPYGGAGPAVMAVVSGAVGLAITSVPGALGLIRDGRLRALAVGSEKRLALLPEVPTLAEAGVGADTLTPTFFGLAAPAGTPPAVVAKLNAEMKRAIADPDVADRLVAAGLVPSGTTPEVMAATVKQDVARFGAQARAIGIKPE